MRTLRLSLVGTVSLMLLGGLNGAVAAQSPQPVTTGPWPKLEMSIRTGTTTPSRQVIHAYQLHPER
jgi:hypothetical protein